MALHAHVYVNVYYEVNEVVVGGARTTLATNPISQWYTHHSPLLTNRPFEEASLSLAS